MEIIHATAHYVRALCVAWLLFVWSTPTSAAYPDREITLVVPARALNGDKGFAAREFAPLLSKYLGVKVNLLSFPNHVSPTKVAHDMVAHAKPDGYTLLFASATDLVMGFATGEGDTQPWERFDIVEIVTRQPYVCVTAPNSPYKDWRVFFNTLKTNPQTIRHATWNQVSRLFSIFYMRLLGVRYERIQAVTIPTQDHPLTALREGRGDFSCWTPSSILDLLKNQSVVPIFATNSFNLDSLAPIPLASKIGLRGAERYTYWTAFGAPKGLPKDVRQKLKAAMKKIAADPEWHNTMGVKYGSNSIDKFTDIPRFMQEENDFYENLAVLSKITQN